MPNVPTFIALSFLGLFLLFPGLSCAQDKDSAPPSACSVNERDCVIAELRATAESIDNQNWRDQIYRELAKTLAFDGQIDEAIAVLNLIKTPDTQALTIRGIGMAAADNKLSQAEYDALFARLRTEAEKITHKPSYAIALTYIAMAQAFAGDDDGAWKTASEMTNDALRHKAFGETAEIQAEMGKFDEAMKSIAAIDSAAYQNKSYSIVSKILADRGQLDEALKAAQAVSNPYKKAMSLQYVLDVQHPRDVEKKLIVE